MIGFNGNDALVSGNEISNYKEKVVHACQKLKVDEQGGWVDYPVNYDEKVLENIIKSAEKIQKESDVFIVIGIGGSYIGARACIEMLTHSFYNLQDYKERKTPQIFFAGYNLSGTYHKELVDFVKDKDVSICVISKSGTTPEPNIAFSIFKDLLEKKYKSEAKERIYVITDKEKGILRKEVNERGYTSFIVPDNIGGRYSVLTPVGLLPIAVAGIDIKEILNGAREGYHQYLKEDMNNPCCSYAAMRNILFERGKIIEVFEAYEPKLQYFMEWLKQLFGESEGKEKKGIYPTSLQMSTDLHSMGQFLQEGNQCFFETVLNVEKPQNDVTILNNNLFNTNSLNEVNQKAVEGVRLAHIEDDIPNIRINIPNFSPYYFGQLVYFFEKACAISGYLLGVNPFDQPGVEKYKSKMRQLLK